MKLKLGTKELEMDGPYLTKLRDSSDLINNPESMRDRMKEDGYLFIRRFHNRDSVLAAREELLSKLAKLGKLEAGKSIDDGYIATGSGGYGFRNEALEYPAFRNLVNSREALGFFKRFLGGECITYDTKWFRAVDQGGFSGAHYDIVYMGRGTHNLYTMWTPIGDIPLEMGGLAICLGSHRFDKIIQSYGKSDYESVGGWFSNDPAEVIDQFGGQWATADFEIGDVIIFGMYTMHCSLTNQTNRYRLSADTRYQLRSEPVDSRWYGSQLKSEIEAEAPQSMADARKTWGI